MPFRDSVLTRILADSLTGNSLTTIVTTVRGPEGCRMNSEPPLRAGALTERLRQVSPARSNAAESKSTLGYGATARRIKTKPVINDSNDSARIGELEAEVRRGTWDVCRDAWDVTRFTQHLSEAWGVH